MAYCLFAFLISFDRVFFEIAFLFSSEDHLENKTEKYCQENGSSSKDLAYEGDMGISILGHPCKIMI